MVITEESTRETTDDLSQVTSGAVIAPAILGAQTVDLNTSNAELADSWIVEQSNRLTIEAIIDSGT